MDESPKLQTFVPGKVEDDSAAQLATMVGHLMTGIKPIAEQQAQVQLAQIAAARERDDRAFRLARSTLFTGAGILVGVLILLALATAFLFMRGNEEAGMQVIWFAMGALGGFGVGRVARSRP